MTTTDVTWMHAQVADLEHRIVALESRISGSTRKPPHHELLVSLYLDALKGPRFEDDFVRHWERQTFALDVRQLLVLARSIRDPFPWRPFLRNADLYVAKGFDFSEARTYLLDLARDLLRIQGLSKLSPRDVMGHALPDLSRLTV